MLDVGCGDGKRTLANLAGGTETIGLDFSRRGLELVRDVVPGARLVQADMTAIPLPDRSVDAITAYHAVFHVPRAQHPAVYRDFDRVLRSRGTLLMTVGTSRHEGTRSNWLGSGHPMFWSTPGGRRPTRSCARPGSRQPTSEPSTTRSGAKRCSSSPRRRPDRTVRSDAETVQSPRPLFRQWTTDESWTAGRVRDLNRANRRERGGRGGAVCHRGRRRGRDRARPRSTPRRFARPRRTPGCERRSPQRREYRTRPEVE